MFINLSWTFLVSDASRIHFFLFLLALFLRFFLTNLLSLAYSTSPLNLLVAFCRNSFLVLFKVSVSVSSALFLFVNIYVSLCMSFFFFLFFFFFVFSIVCSFSFKASTPLLLLDFLNSNPIVFRIFRLCCLFPKAVHISCCRLYFPLHI